MAKVEERAGIAQRLAIYVDPGSGEPLRRQIVDRIWLEVVTGTLDPGERLPTVRQLAIELSLPPSTLAGAYKELELLGVLATRPGGTFVTLTSPDTSALERRAQLERLCRDLVAQAKAFDFSVDDIIDALSELRSLQRNAEGRDTE